MRIEWLIAAEDDLREVARRVAINFGEDTAKRVVEDVVDETARLADFPKIGRLCHEYRGARREYRALHTCHDRIVYTITASCVLIVAVFDTRRDPADLVHMIQEREDY